VNDVQVMNLSWLIAGAGGALDFFLPTLLFHATLAEKVLTQATVAEMLPVRARKSWRQLL
jgi:hypothetical protein